MILINKGSFSHCFPTIFNLISKNCYNFDDFRKLAKKNLPAPIFHYIDGGSDDEVTLKRNTESFSKCDLVPDILASVGEPDMSTEVLGKKIKK